MLLKHTSSSTISLYSFIAVLLQGLYYKQQSYSLTWAACMISSWAVGSLAPWDPLNKDSGLVNQWKVVFVTWHVIIYDIQYRNKNLSAIKLCLNNLSIFDIVKRYQYNELKFYLYVETLLRHTYSNSHFICIHLPCSRDAGYQVLQIICSIRCVEHLIF